MKLVESILTKNPCYTAGRTITVSNDRMPASADADATIIQFTSPKTADVPIVATAV